MNENETLGIVAVGCGLDSGGRMTPQTLANTAEAVKIFKEEEREDGRPYLIVLGGNGTKLTTEASKMKQHAVKQGINYKQIICDKKSRNTLENAKECLRICQEHRITEITLVACQPHFPVVQLCFSRIFEMNSHNTKVNFVEVPEQEYSRNACQWRLGGKRRFRFWNKFSYLFYKIFAH